MNVRDVSPAAIRSICPRSFSTRACSKGSLVPAAKMLLFTTRAKGSMRALQVFLQRDGLGHRGDFRQRHENDAGIRGVLQPHQRRRDTHHAARIESLRYLTMIRADGVHQQQRMSRRCGIEDDERTASLLDDARECVEDSNFLGAWRTQILKQQRAPLFVEIGALRGHDLVDIAPRLFLRIDATYPQARQFASDSAGNMRGRIGSAQVYGLAALNETDGQSRCEVVLPTPPMTMTMTMTALCCGKLVYQLTTPRCGEPLCGNGTAALCRDGGPRIKHGPKGL